jgi:glutathionylspermidine synthase
MIALEDTLLRGGIICDPYLGGRPRFSAEPVIVEATALDAMCDVAEKIALVYDETARLCKDDPKVLDAFFELTPCQKLMWQLSSPLWHGVARADVFETTSGLKITELNSDTPTGQAEAVVLGELARADRPELVDPNEGLESSFMDLIEAVAARALGPDFRRTCGIVYPTDLTEDLPLIRLYERWLTARGFRVVTGSPFNLRQRADKTPVLFDVPCSVVLRHYKTDWWGERLPVWIGDPPFDDPLPLAGPLKVLAEAEAFGRAVVLNPFGAVVTQNKRSMALMWERIDDLSPAAQAIVRAHVPRTLRLESLHKELLCAERDLWVVKSDYGAEGDEVVVGKHATQAEWDEVIARAQPGRFVAQERFDEIERSGGASRNYGIFVIGGRAAGAYVRSQDGPTDVHALSAPILMKPRGRA